MDNLSEKRMMKTQNTTHKRQQGVALVMFTMGMVVMIGIAGLALDLSHVMLDDSRLQNALDACALSGTQVLMETSGNDDAKMTAARIAAEDTFLANRGTDFANLGRSDVIVGFSDTLEVDPFPSTTVSPRYVSCTVNNHSVSTSLAHILSIDTLGLNVTAVAGAIPIKPCNVVPLLVCGTPGSTCDFGDDSCYGFDVYKEDDQGNPTITEGKCYLKACPPGTHCDDLEGELGPSCGAQSGAPTGGGGQVADISAGNFQFLDMVCESGKTGKNCIKEALEQGGAVVQGGCPTIGENVTSEPGNAASIIDSFNSIFMGSNADTNALSPRWYSEYLDGNPEGNDRRVLNIVIGNCSSPIVKGGKTEVPVLTTGCFFATEIAVKVKGRPVIWGQFIGECPGTGNITTTPNAFDTYKIVLYKDHGSPDS